MAVIGKFVLHRRQELGITQEELATMMGYKTKTTINKIESGKQDIPLSKVEELAKCLHTTPAYLMGWEEDAFDDARRVGTLMGKMTRDPRAVKILSFYEVMTAENKEKLLQVAEALSLLV